MTRLTFSPDVLAENPDLAAKLRTSKAVTPSGRGNGYTDDAQAYTNPPPVAGRAWLAHYVRHTLAMMRVWGEPWEGKEATELRRAIGDYLSRLGG